MNLLVCGGAGFIGSNFIRYMLKKYPKINIWNFDKLTYAGNRDNLKEFEYDERYNFVKGDITNFSSLENIIKNNNINYIINFAAETHVDRSIYGVCSDFVLTNTLGVQTILDAIKLNKKQIKKFVNVSTDEVYGALDFDTKNIFSEETPIKPNMPYAAAKAGGDLMCHSYYVTHKVPVIVTHCSNNYGPYQFPEKLIPFFIFKLLNNQKVPMYGNGLNVRDWIHVDDHASALDLLLHKGEAGEVYNIGADNERSNLEVTKMLLDAFDKSEDMIEYVKDRPGHDLRYAIDATKITELGWAPVYTRENFLQGLKETIYWYINNQEWVQAIKLKKEKELNDFDYLREQQLDKLKAKKELKVSDNFKIVKINKIDTRNYALSPCELKEYIDFEAKRMYWLKGNSGETGSHCHLEEREFFVVLNGSATVEIDKGNGLEEYILYENDGVYIGSYIWHHFKNISKNTIILALSSTNYRPDRSDYIEDYEVFKEKVKQIF